MKNIAEFFADYAVIGAGAIHSLHGVMDQHVDEAAIAKKMMENSDKLIVLADSTKTNKHVFILDKEEQIECIFQAEIKNRKVSLENKDLFQIENSGKLSLILQYNFYSYFIYIPQI